VRTHWVSPGKFCAKAGVTLPTISRWENGRSNSSPLVLKQVEDLLQDRGDPSKNLLQKFSRMSQAKL